LPNVVGAGNWRTDLLHLFPYFWHLDSSTVVVPVHTEGVSKFDMRVWAAEQLVRVLEGEQGQEVPISDELKGNLGLRTVSLLY
jgi:hypothetical protein